MIVDEDLNPTSNLSDYRNRGDVDVDIINLDELRLQL
jgi:hypothetical protein